MPRIKPSYILIGLVLAVTGITLWQSLSQPGVGDLAGGYKEVALYRNENNTGPIVRIYAITSTDTLWQEMKTYGDLMPYTKYGTTMVYFFPAQGDVPVELYPGEENFGAQHKQHCLALYKKDKMGQISFIKYPFR